MQIENGKYYRTRAGRKVGPVIHYDRGLWCDISTGGLIADGDIVAEWTEGPVRTVTRREIVPGIFGRNMHVGKPEDGKVHVSIGGPGMVMQLPMYSADELEAAANTLLELAGALRDA